MKKTILSLISLLCATFAFAQPMGGGFVQVASPVVNPDNTVTFNYRNDNAKEVLVDVQFAGRQAMTKNDKGVWTITLGPANPDIYPYCFVVDGISVMDPLNPDWFPNETFKNSLLDIRGTGDPLIHAVREVPHGSVDYLNYWSESLGTWANAIVYTPPFYDQNPDKKYPVMYLISGTTDTEEVYYKVGKMNLILDNLIAEGNAKEMILVLPYGNPSLYFPAGSNVRADFNKDFLEDLMPFVEKNYRTINDRDHRGIGGFSRGGNQGLAIGLNNLDKFSYLCSYSSFTSVRDSQFEDADAVNAKIHLFWLGIGTDDFLYGNSKDLMDMLDKHGIKNIKEFTYDKFGHTWMNSRYWLDKSFRLLFQDDDVIAAEKGMDLAEAEKVRKASAAGKEMSRLTPTLMTSLFPAGVTSPEYNADGSVTFRCQAPDATKVELECQMFNGTKPMRKDFRTGVWTITVTPDQPDIYPYCFVIDGTQVADPNNMFIFPNESFKYSLADVRGSVPTTQDIQNVPHGKVAYRLYHSKGLGFDRPVCIYTPAGYEPKGDEKLPVLYLIHGMTDTYETWYKVGRMNNIMDNLIDKGLAERMIVVMPYANPAPEQAKRGLKATGTMDTQAFVDEMMNEVIPYVESNYNVLTDPANRAIAGFSLGGRETMATGLKYPDKFNWVCAFAPAIFGEEYKTNFENGTYAPLDEVKKNLKLFFLGTGRDDFLIEASRGLHSYLQEQGMPHTFYNPAGGHTWMNCRDYLELIAKQIFKPEAKSPVTNINANGYPKLMPDNSVAFKFRGPADAKPQIDICGKRYDMLRDPEGNWCTQTDPLVPGYHYYTIVVNGIASADPASQSYYGTSKMCSAIEIPEEGCELFETQDVPHGQVRELRYFSNYTKTWRPVLVYTPASYEKGKKKYPVVYIHHGGGEDYRGWMEQGRTANIMDNLIAEGKAAEMIVVSVDSNVPAKPTTAPRTGGYSWESMQGYREELIDNIIPFIEKTFRVKSDKHSRAMCGLSMGGGQSFYIGLHSTDVFANIASFSAGIFGGINGSSNFDLEKEAPGILSNTAAFNASLDNFFLSCGEQDPRINYTRKAAETMKEAGVNVKFDSFPGDHEWQVWRKSFAEFAQMLFK